MEHSRNISAPEASTDERASLPQSDANDWPDFATREEAMAYWAGVRRGIGEAGRDFAHPHLPADFEVSLARDGARPR